MDVLAYPARLAAHLATNEQRHLDPDVVRPGYVALFIFLAMVLALVLLMWSFVRMSRKAREPWEGEDVDGAASENTDQPEADR